MEPLLAPVTPQNLHQFLPLIKQYQAFYQATPVDEVTNRRFFSQFSLQSDKGCLFGCWLGGEQVAFASVYFGYASTLARQVAIMNDLYVVPERRRQGLARALVSHCQAFARSRGAARLQWLTAHDNTEAQALYRSLGARQSSWEFFTLSC